MCGTQTMRPITEITAVAVPVSDQEGALRFYTEVLGFEVVRDERSAGQRWIEVTLGGRTTLALVPEDLEAGTAPVDTKRRHLDGRHRRSVRGAPTPRR